MKVAVIALYPMVRKGIISIISKDKDIEFLGEASSSREGLVLLERTKPDITLVDANLGDRDGLEFIMEARKKDLISKFMVMGFHGSRKFISRAMDMGIDGCILREAHPDEILYAIRHIGRGKRYYDSDLLDYIDNRDKGKKALGLTPREEEVLVALSKGLTNKQIAESFFITEHTVKKHVSQILSKLQLKDRTQAAIFANTRKLTS